MELEIVSFNNDMPMVRVVGETRLGEHIAITRDGQVIIYCWVTKDARAYDNEKDGPILFR